MSTTIDEYTQYHVSHDLRIQITPSASKSNNRVLTKSRNTIPQESTKCPLTHHTQLHNFIEPTLSKCEDILRVYIHTQPRVKPFELPLNNMEAHLDIAMLYMEMNGEGNQFHESNFISKVWEGSQFTAHREFFIDNYEH